MTAVAYPSAEISTSGRPWVRPVVQAWIVSRLAVGVGLVVGAAWRSGTLANANGFFAWDGQWYLRTATVGYGAAPLPGQQSSWPFFPLLPGLLRATRAVGLPAGPALIVLNHLVLLVALIGLWQLAARQFGHEIANRSVWILSVFPTSGVFSMLYPSAIFLAGSVWAFEYVARRAWAMSGLAAAIATTIRPNGAATALIVAAIACRSCDRDRWRATALVGGPAAGALAGWIIVCTVATGNPLVFATAKAAWNEQTIVALARQATRSTPLDSLTVHVVVGLLAVTLLRGVWNELEPSWRVLVLVTLGVPMITGLVGLGRYSNECFPIAIAGGATLARLPAPYRRVLLASSTVLSIVFAATMAGHGLVP